MIKNQSSKSMQSLFVIMIVVVISISSCSYFAGQERYVSSSYIGQEIVIVDNLDCYLRGCPLKYDMDNADYKIVTYIDSSGCTTCQMRLSKWEEIIDKYKSYSESEIEFLMILTFKA